MDGLNGYAYETGAWLIVHWLIDTRPVQFHTFLERLSRGENTWNAFNAAFPGLHEEEIRDGIRAWLREGPKTVERALPDVEIAPTVTATDPAEVLALRAELLRLGPSSLAGADRKEAVAKQARQALAIDPGQPLALALIADSDAMAATSAHPGDWRGWVLVHDRKQEDRASIEQAARLQPVNPGVLIRLAVSDLRAGDREGARRYAVHAAEVAPGRSDVLDTLAQIKAADHRCHEALDLEQRALDSVADSASSGVPASLRRRMNAIASDCIDAPVEQQAVATEPRLKSCSEPLPAFDDRTPSLLNVEYTVLEDGSVANVSIKGQLNTKLSVALRRYLESCRYEPATVGGKVQAARMATVLRKK
jgi:hypothetical protein